MSIMVLKNNHILYKYLLQYFTVHTIGFFFYLVNFNMEVKVFVKTCI